MKKSNSNAKTDPSFDAKHIAHLAKLQMSEEEIQKFAGELAPVLEYVNQLKELPTDGVDPLVTPTEIEYRMREDKVEQNSTAEQAVANAPEKTGNLFKVPPVV